MSGVGEGERVIPSDRASTRRDRSGCGMQPTSTRSGSPSRRAQWEVGDMKSLIVRLLREDDGQDLVEYVLLVSLIALAVALAFPPVTAAITGVFTGCRPVWVAAVAVALLRTRLAGRARPDGAPRPARHARSCTSKLRSVRARFCADCSVMTAGRTWSSTRCWWRSSASRSSGRVDGRRGCRERELRDYPNGRPGSLGCRPIRGAR